MHIPDTDDQFNNLIHNVTVLRQRHGLSRKEMAKILHISPYILRMLENSRISSRLYVNFLFYLRDSFHISFHDMFHTQLQRKMPRMCIASSLTIVHPLFTRGQADVRRAIMSP